MSHSTQIDNVVFIHDGEPKNGEVDIRIWSNSDHEGLPISEITISYNALAEFVGRMIQHKKICELEQQTGISFLESL